MAKDIISDGLAVSYFYNFIKRIFDNLTEQSKASLKDENFNFPYSKVSLDVVLPSELNEDSIEKCRQFVFQKNEVRLSIERGRDMSFFVEDLGADSKLIVDFPTTIGSILEFLKIDLDNLSGFLDVDTNSEDWINRGQMELDKFKEILEFLIKSYPSTNGKATVRFLE